MLGFIHPSERYAEPRLGQVLEARVIGFREVDRTLNLSLKPRSFEMLENDAQMILTYLESNGGFMTLNDKSSPAEMCIRDRDYTAPVSHCSYWSYL